jgi:hypothetical protein
MKHAGRVVQDQTVKVVRNGEGGSRSRRQPTPSLSSEFARRERTRRRFGGVAARGTGDTSSVEGARNLMRGRRAERCGTAADTGISLGECAETSGERSGKGATIRKLNAERDVEVHERMTTPRT